MQTIRIYEHFKIVVLIMISILIIMAWLIIPPNAKASPLNTQAGYQIDGVIVYVELDGELYLLVGDTGERIQLTDDANIYRYILPKFSPNGQYLAFLKSNPEKGETVFNLHVMDLSTKETRVIAENLDDSGGYDWAPDSQSIAFGFSFDMLCRAPDQTETYGIWQVQLDSGMIEEIIPPEKPYIPLNNPEYSSDGKWLSYESFPCFSEGFQLHTFDILTNNRYEIGSLAESDWSSDQNWLAYSLDNWDGGYGAIVFGTADLSDRQILLKSSNVSFGDPNWSPDAQMIAIRQFPLIEGPFIPDDIIASWEDQLIYFNLTSKEEYIVCSSREIWGCRMVKWSPSGNQLIYTVHSESTVKWFLYTIANGESTSLPEFGNGGIDWISSDHLPQTHYPTVEIKQADMPTQITTLVPDQVINPDIEEDPISFFSSLGSLIVICGGIGILLLSVVLIIFFILKQKR